MDYGHEIEKVDRQLADSDRAVEASAELRKQRAALAEAQRRKDEADQRAREADAAARAVRDAEAAARQAEAAPMLDEARAIEHQLAADDADAQQHLGAAVEVVRAIHGRRQPLLARHDHLRAVLARRGEYGVNRLHAVNLAAYTREQLARVIEGER